MRVRSIQVTLKITTAVPILCFNVPIMAILYIYNYYEALPYELLKCFSTDVRFILGKRRVLRAFNIFSQCVFSPNCVCVGCFCYCFSCWKSV